MVYGFLATVLRNATQVKKLAKTAKKKKEPQMTQMSADLIKEGGHSCPPLPKNRGLENPLSFISCSRSDPVPATPDQATKGSVVKIIPHS